jgi:hypothetical protein
VPFTSSSLRAAGTPIPVEVPFSEGVPTGTVAPEGAEGQAAFPIVVTVVGGFDLVAHHPQEGHAIYLRGRLGGSVIRVSPARDPAQPRLWCLLVEHRGTVGPIGQRLGAVIGPGGLTREEALAALSDLAADPATWLGRSRRRRLRAWLRRETGEPTASSRRST